MQPFEQLETSRLRLRPPHLQDAQTIFDNYAQDLDVTRYLAWQPHRDITETTAFLERRQREWQGGSYRTTWAITLIDDDEAIGMFSMRELAPFRVSISYVLASAHWGNGYLTELAGAVTDWLLKQDAIYRVEAYCDVDNHASVRVLEKIGMEREGVLRKAGFTPNISDKPRDALCYAKVK